MTVFFTLFVSHVIILFIGYSFGSNAVGNTENNYYYDYYDPDFGEHSNDTNDISNNEPTANS